jgi:hypothetical protein
MLREQSSRLTTALKRALGNFDSAADDPIVAMKTAVEVAVREDEDVLTALIFERLRYLPDSIAWAIVVEAATVLRGDPPRLDGPLVDEVWPALRHPETGALVEPDVVWHTGQSRVGIEVKWKGAQDVGQLDREYKALAHREAGTAVTLLALGGMNAQRLAQLKAECVAPSLLALDWPKLYQEAWKARRGKENAPPTERLLDDILAILAMRNPLWARPPLHFSSLPGWTVTLSQTLGPAARPAPAPGPGKASLGADGARAFSSLPSVQLTVSATSLPRWRRP